jgi:predicted phage-related endonuclease
MKPHRLKVEKILIEDRQNWLALRRQDVTASTVGCLFDAHPYQTMLGLFAEKTGVQMADEDTTAMRRGRLLESAVAEAFREEHPGWKVVKCRHYYRAPALRLGATPDFIFIDPQGRRGVLQTKTVAPHVFRQTWTDETPPFWIALQTLTEAMLTKSDYGMIGALECDGFKFGFHPYEVPRHPAAERRIQDAVQKFWSDIAEGKVPQIDFRRDAPVLAIMYPRETTGKSVDLRGDNRITELLDTRERAAAAEKAAEAEKQTAENEIKAKLEDAEIGVVNGWRLSFRQQTRKEHMVKESKFRVLRVARDNPKREEAA